MIHESIDLVLSPRPRPKVRGLPNKSVDLICKRVHLKEKVNGFLNLFFLFNYYEGRSNRNEKHVLYWQGLMFCKPLGAL